jgi:hypothetical protein
VRRSRSPWLAFPLPFPCPDSGQWPHSSPETENGSPRSLLADDNMSLSGPLPNHLPRPRPPELAAMTDRGRRSEPSRRTAMERGTGGGVKVPRKVGESARDHRVDSAKAPHNHARQVFMA